MKKLIVIFIVILIFSCNLSEENPKSSLEVFSPKALSIEKPMLEGFDGWEVYPLFTVGESFNNFFPLGKLDGIGVTTIGNNLKIFVNHELDHSEGYTYNSKFKGARITSFELNKSTLEINNMRNAFNSIINREGKEVSSPNDIKSGKNGFSKFCSSSLFNAGTYNLVNDLYFSGEEISEGQINTLDINSNKIYVTPSLGRGAWENLTFLETGNQNLVAVLLSDDSTESPMYLYIGTKNNSGDFLDKNGLKNGKMYVWKSNDGINSHSEFKGTNQTGLGKFVEIQYKSRFKNTFKFDNLGYLRNRDLQIKEAKSKKAFLFNRPEDIHTNPNKKNEAVFATTGYNGYSNKYGAIYTINVDFSDLNNITAPIKIIYDSNETGELGIRNPDNLVWANDGNIYINEDPATANFVEPNSPGIWKLSPTGSVSKIAKVNYNNIPSDQNYNNKNWETSGVIDISKYYSGGTWLLVNVQAHGVTGGRIDQNNLVEGGQMLLLRKP